MIRMKGIRKEYRMGDSVLAALDGVDIHIKPHEFVSIIGPSGSGKSTLMNIIGCLDTADEGTYYLDGQEIEAYTEDELADIRGRKIGFVFQQFNLLRSQNQIDSFRIQNITLHIFDHITRQLIETHLDQTILYFFSTIMFHQFSGI